MRHRGFLARLLVPLFLALSCVSGAAAAPATKLGAHLRVVKTASPQKLRALSRHLGIHADKPVPTVDILVRTKPGAHLQDLAARHGAGLFHSEAGGVVTAEVPLALLDALDADPNVAEVSVSRKMKPNLNVVRSTAVAGGAYLGIMEAVGDLISADGAGVIVGVIDTGIDFRHADFNFSGGLPFSSAPFNSRLISVWDQCDRPPHDMSTCNSGNLNPPTGFGYGIECTTNGGSPFGINNGSCEELDYDGHGTNVMGIAAGNGRAAKDNAIPAGKYTGVAKNASLVFVRTDFSDSHVIDAMNYLIGKAAGLGKKLVINMSFGGQGGGHDGLSAFETAISAAAASTPIAIAMGNDSRDAPHANFFVPVSGAVTTSVNTTTSSGFNRYTEFIDTEFWYPNGDNYTLTVSVNGGPSGSVSFAVGENATKSLGSGVTVQAVHATNSNGDRQLFVEVDDSALLGTLTRVNYQLTRTVTGGNGNVDGYTQPAILGTSFNDHVAPYGTLTVPATADNVFSVAAYNTKSQWPVDDSSPFDPPATCNDGSGFISYALPVPPLGQIADFSGLGPRRNGAGNTLSNGTNGAKPDIAAPGQGIASSLSNQSTPSTCFVVDDGVHFVDQGTSQATPVVTGVMALMLGVNPALTVPQIRTALQATARSDGGEGVLPNNTWGPGKLAAAPTKVRAAPSPVSSTVLGTSSVTFSWSLVANATSFNLYNALPPNNYMTAFVGNSDTLTGLLPNTLYGVSAKGVNGYGEGPAATLFVAATLPNVPVVSQVQTFPSSMTVTFSAGAGGASSFTLFASTAADTYSGTVFSSATTPVTKLSLTGLAASTAYCLRLSAFNQGGAPNSAMPGCFSTTNPYVAPPIVQPPDSITQSQIQFYWTQGGNPISVNYSADASADPTFATGVTNIQGSDKFQALFTGLQADTSYYFRVRANTGPYSSTGPYATHAGLPVATAASTFTAVGANSLTANWGRGPNAVDTLFLVQASADPAFGSIAASAQLASNSAAMGGLNPNTTYYARVEAISRDDTPSGFFSLGSVSTLGAPPVPTVFTNQTVTGFTANYSGGGNGPGTVFIAQISLDGTAAFSPVAASSQTFNTFAVFTGLTPNQQYFFRAGAINNGGGTNFNGFAQEISTFTAPVAPVPTSPAISNQTVASLQANWGAGANAAGTQYTAQICTTAGCGVVVQTISNIAGLSQVFSAGLLANATYFVQVQALHRGATNPDSSFVLIGGAATLANAPAAPTVQPVQYTSFTITFPSLPGFPPNLTCEGYRVQAARDAAFTNIAFTTDLQGFASNSAALTGLSPGTTYYVRVGSLNWGGLPDYSAAVSTMTLMPIQSTGTVKSSGLTLTVNPLGVPVTSIQLVVPPATLPAGTLVTVNTTVGYLLPPPVSNEATLVSLGANMGFTIDASGMQPVGEVDVIMRYDPLQLPPGVAAKNIQLARYDPAAGQWTLLPTSVDTAQNAIIGRISHFSLYAPFGVTPAGDLSKIQVFPVPWEPHAGNGLLDANVITFANLPGGAHVRIMSVTGALMWSADASTNGVLTWDGTNRFGRTLGSGTYLAIIESQGVTTVKRVVIIR